MPVSRRLALAAVILTGAFSFAPAPASAQNFFDLLFGGFRRAAPPPPAAPQPYPYPDAFPDGDFSRDPGGPAIAFCVRTCDGRFFPVKAGNPAQICNLLCPAAPTKIFFGSQIEYAVANDGRSYRDMPNAFLHRDRVVEGCSCNGKGPLGLARIAAKNDPTLQPGDIVATGQGLMQATGRNGGFTPISGETARRLSHIKVAPVHDAEAGDDIPGYNEFLSRSARRNPRAQSR